MLKLKEFDQTDYYRNPWVENLFGDIVPMVGQAKVAAQEDWLATIVIDGNGILITMYNEAGQARMVFCREIIPFPLAVLVAKNLEEPLDPQNLIELGFERFK